MVAPLAMLGLSLAGDVIGGLVSSATGASSKGGEAPNEKLKKTAQDFESVFLEQAFGRMAEGAGEAGPLGGGQEGGGVYRSMLVKEYAGSVVKSGGVGIADSVYRQMLKMQEG